MTKIVIVNDGQYAWGADKDKLEAAMEKRGWAKEGRRWIEPDLGDDADPAEAYTELCQDVQPAEGYDVGQYNETWDELPTLRFREDLGHGVWSY